ncbi:MAG TPA: isoprenylcysteine carboxylmethyltransferase family protein [Tepidisphaeraceae bacterium]|nr:isoprenylcysteine carboxylmethyltransferase family protein [Tepidisphaeraceae bacterium]
MSLRIPALLLGVILVIYWGRVLQMAARSRKRSGRSANLIPRETLGRVLRLFWAPAIIIWVGQPWVTALSQKAPAFLVPFYSNSCIAWAAVAVCTAGLATTWICWKKMGRQWRMGIDPTDKSQLISTGPYAYVRHPIYAISQAMMVVAVCALPSPLMIVAGAVHLILIQWEARREENYLLNVNRAAYEAYCLRVGRFIPRLAGKPVAEENELP